MRKGPQVGGAGDLQGPSTGFRSRGSALEVPHDLGSPHQAHFSPMLSGTNLFLQLVQPRLGNTAVPWLTLVFPSGKQFPFIPIS